MIGPNLKLLLSLFVVLILTGKGIAQPSNHSAPKTDSLSWYIEMKYGLDQELFNGFQYYKHYIQYMGDPFFPDDAFYPGSLSSRGIRYEDLHLKYDSYSQYLILEYSDFTGIYNQLILNGIHIDSFHLGGYYFQKLSLTDGNPLFYQVLNSGSLTCYIHWKKEISSISYDFQYTHEFSKLKGTYYINYGEQIHPFTNKKSFISIFPASLQADIKKYFRQQRFNFREADPTDIQDILNFIVANMETPPRP